ncbi:hypothetical protein [Paenibacillus marinisediminis]
MPTSNLDPYERGIVRDLINEHRLTEKETLEVYVGNKRTINLLDGYEPTDFYADQIMENRKNGITCGDWEERILKNRMECRWE